MHLIQIFQTAVMIQSLAKNILRTVLRAIIINYSLWIIYVRNNWIWIDNTYKAGVINDPLGQPTVPAGNDCRLILKFCDGRTDTLCENSENYWPGLWSVSWINFCILRYFYQPDVEGVFGGQDCHELLHGNLEQCARGLGPLGGLHDVMRALRPHGSKKWVKHKINHQKTLINHK